MCGIAGYSLTREEASKVNTQLATATLLKAIEPRGRDAAGIAWRKQQDGWYQKAPMPAGSLVPLLDDHNSWTMICHTRFATQGTPDVNENNHPIHVDGVVGVHNGTLDNDSKLFRDLNAPRIAEVDSEAIFAALRYGPENLGHQHPTEALSMIEGRMAVAWFGSDDPNGTLHLARGEGSPLIVAQTKGGSLFFASTSDAIKAAVAAVGLKIKWQETTPEGAYMRVRYGRIVETCKFKVPVRQTWRSYRPAKSSALGTDPAMLATAYGDAEELDRWWDKHSSDGSAFNSVDDRRAGSQ